MYPHSRLSLWLYKIIFSYLNYKHASLSLSPSFSSIIIIIICVFSSSSSFQSLILLFLLFALISFNGSWSSNEKKISERMNVSKARIDGWMERKKKYLLMYFITSHTTHSLTRSLGLSLCIFLSFFIFTSSSLFDVVSRIIFNAFFSYLFLEEIRKK